MPRLTFELLTLTSIYAATQGMSVKVEFADKTTALDLVMILVNHFLILMVSLMIQVLILRLQLCALRTTITWAKSKNCRNILTRCTEYFPIIYCLFYHYQLLEHFRVVHIHQYILLSYHEGSIIVIFIYTVHFVIMHTWTVLSGIMLHVWSLTI